MKNTVAAFSLSLIFLFTSAAFSGEADVVDAVAYQDHDGTWRFDVTVAHADTGWEHYADKWEVLGPDGAILATRLVYHPHVAEQPFTRSLVDVRIPEDVGVVRLRAHDSVHKYGGQEFEVELRR